MRTAARRNCPHHGTCYNQRNGGAVQLQTEHRMELRDSAPDHGKDYMASAPKYDDFCTVPDHVGYKPVVGKFLNLYEPISHVPRQGDFLCIRSLVGHIFGEQYELGMDSLLQLLYFAPFRNLSWLKRHFICARILLKLACVMPK